MSLPVSFRRAAKVEFDTAALWYDERQVGLGHQFVDEINRAIGLAAKDPQKFPVKHGAIRRVQARRFPYLVYFVHEPRRIVVLAVFHARRDPAVWQDRS